MPTDKQYWIEKREPGVFVVEAEGSKKASALCDTQKEAIEIAKQFNPNKKPHVARVRNVPPNHPDRVRKTP
jgi:hypothetical protein